MLISQLERFVTLNPFQLAGQTANLDFWVSEIRHALDVLDGYQARFEQLRTAERDYAARHGTGGFDPTYPHELRGSTPRPVRLPDGELKRARTSLCDAAYRFLVRCCQAGVLDAQAVRAACGTLKISVDANDLRRSRKR